MYNFDQFTNEKPHVDRINETLVFMFNALGEETITEGKIKDSIKGSLSYLGKQIKNSQSVLGVGVRGAIQIGKLFAATIKGDKEEMKKHAVGINKQDMISVLRLADLFLIEALYSKIVMLRLVTGIDLEKIIVDIKNRKVKMETLAKKKFEEFKAFIQNVFAGDQEKIDRLTSMEQLLFSQG